MNLPQTSALNDKRKSEGAKRRSALLSLMPTEFTVAQLAHVAALTPDSARAQVQKMLRWKEIEQTSVYKSPRIYRKVIK